MIEYWETAKAILVPGGAAERSLIHVHAGMAIYGIAVLCMRRHFITIVPPMIVTALGVAGELADLSVQWPRIPAWLWWDSGTDIVHTIVWPWLIWAIANRVGPARANQLRRAGVTDASGSATDTGR